MAESSDLIDNMATGKVSTRRHIFTHEHFSTNPHIIFRISRATSVHAFVLLYKRFISSLSLNFYILQIYEQSESPVPSRTNLSCRRAGLPTLQRFRAVACSDFEIIELKQQFCGNRHTPTHTHTHTNQLSTVTLRPRGEG